MNVKYSLFSWNVLSLVPVNWLYHKNLVWATNLAKKVKIFDIADMGWWVSKNIYYFQLSDCKKNFSVICTLGRVNSKKYPFSAKFKISPQKDGFCQISLQHLVKTSKFFLLSSSWKKEMLLVTHQPISATTKDFAFLAHFAKKKAPGGTLNHVGSESFLLSTFYNQMEWEKVWQGLNFE